MTRLALALVLPGCDVLFGIAPVPPAIEVNHGTVTVTYSWTTSTQTASGPVLATQVTPPSDYLDVRAELLDGTNLPVARTTPMTFEFSLPPGATYVLHTQTKDAATATEFQTDAASLNLVDYALDRFDATPAALPISIDYALTYSTAIGPGNFPFLVALGARTQANLAGGVLTPHLDDWRVTATAQGVRGPLLSTTQFEDRLVVERWETDFATIQWLTDALVDPIEMVDGHPIMRGAPGAELLVPPVALDRCAEIDIARLTAQQRLVDLTGWSSPSTGWAVASTVSLAAPPAYLLTLASNYDTASVDQMRDVIYGSPFTGEVDIAVLGANVQKPLAVPGATSFTLYAGTSQITPVPPSSAASCAPVSFGAIGLSTGVKLADQVLATDGQVVMIDRMQRVPFELTIEGGPYDDAQAALEEVVDNGGVTVVRPIVAFHLSSEPPSASIDPTLLVHNHYYVLHTVTRIGFPRARALDLSVIAYPYASSETYSTLFKVGN